jgi:hypothetical protein
MEAQGLEGRTEPCRQQQKLSIGEAHPPELRELVCGWYWSPGVAVPVAVFQPSPDRTLASWLDSPRNVTGTDSTHRDQLDGEDPPTDLAVGGSNPSRRAASA